MEVTPEQVFAELRSACNTLDMEKAHECVRWFLLHTKDEQLLNALHYAVQAVRHETRDSYHWPWWLEFVQQGRVASQEHNSQGYFRIFAPDLDVMMR